jgi:spoIIIJ-associated protein
MEFKGKTIEEAISKGLSELKVSREDVEIKIIDEGFGGLFGQAGARPAMVLMTIDDSKLNSKN